MSVFFLLFLATCCFGVWILDVFLKYLSVLNQLLIWDFSGLSMLTQFPVRTALTVSLGLISCPFILIFLGFFHPFKDLSFMLLTFLKFWIEFFFLLHSSFKSLIIYTRERNLNHHLAFYLSVHLRSVVRHYDLMEESFFLPFSIFSCFFVVICTSVDVVMSSCFSPSVFLLSGLFLKAQSLVAFSK